MYMNDSDKDEQTGLIPKIEIQDPHTASQMIRLIACFLMHLYILPDIKQALTIMEFLKFTQEREFEALKMTNFGIAFMKLFSALICQSVLIIMMSSTESISDMIKDFVAIGFVVEIDDSFASSMKFDGLTEQMIEEVKGKMVIDRPKEGFLAITKQKMKNEGVVSVMKEVYITSIYFIFKNFYVIIYYYLFFYAGVLLCQYKS